MNGRLELGPTKTHAQRTVSLPTFLRNMLRDHLAQPTPDSGPDAFVFTMKGGGPLRHGLVYNRYFRRAVVGDPEKGIEPALPELSTGSASTTCGIRAPASASPRARTPS